MNFKSETSKLIIKIALFAIIFMICDLCLSSLLKNSFKKVGTGELGFQHVIREQYDIVIFGASKSTTNFDPRIISNETEASCYSLGSTGSTFLAQYPQVISILDSYTPKLFIFELVGSDLSASLLSYKEGRVVDRMLIHSDKKNIDNILKQVDEWHFIKSKVRTYKYSSVIADRIVELFRNRSNSFDPKLGFNPKKRNPNFKFENIREDKKDLERDFSNRSPIIENAFNEMLTAIKNKNAHAIFVHSPNYKNVGGIVDPQVIKLIEKHGMSFYDMAIELDKFDYNNYDYYADVLHLSEKGATAYSQQIGFYIKQIFEE